MDHGHLEMKGGERNIMKVSTWLTTEENTTTTLSTAVQNIMLFFRLNVFKYIVRKDWCNSIAA